MTLPNEVLRLLLLLPQRGERWPQREEWLAAFTRTVRDAYPE